MLKRIIAWLREQWREYQENLEIQRAAEALRIHDAGWAEEEGTRVLIHFACPTRARVGIQENQFVCWCYRCRKTWHRGDDDDGGGPKPPPRSFPISPTGYISPQAREVYEACMARIEKRREKASV